MLNNVMIYLVRHGETEWSLASKHTGLTDLPLTENGRSQAVNAQDLLSGIDFAAVWCSPLKRARETCELAGFSSRAEIMPELVEWDYGDYEGLTSAQIHQTRPGWNIFDHGAQGGESIAQVEARAHGVISKASDSTANILIFSSGHMIRMIMLAWIKQPASLGKHFNLDTAAVCILDHEKSHPSIRQWNLSGPSRLPT
ncbi:MAG: histidine phosphatase family protein [Myxococcota bacterium]